MAYPKRKHPRLKEYDYGQNGAYFITICTKDRAALLGQVNMEPVIRDESELGMRQIHLSATGELCRQLLEAIPNHYDGVTLDCFVIMPDHIHMVLVLDDTACTGGQRSGRPTIPNILHAFKRLSSRQANTDLWQASFYEHIIRNEKDMAEIRAYILQNPL